MIIFWIFILLIVPLFRRLSQNFFVFLESLVPLPSCSKLIILNSISPSGLKAYKKNPKKTSSLYHTLHLSAHTPSYSFFPLLTQRKPPCSYQNPSCSSVDTNPSPLVRNMQKEFSLFLLCNPLYFYHHTHAVIFQIPLFSKTKNFLLTPLPPHPICGLSLKQTPCRIRLYSVSSSLCPFFLKPLQSLYFPSSS